MTLDLSFSSVFIITIAHKVFGITTWLPDNAMRWTGQQVQSLGEGQEPRGAGKIVASHDGSLGNTAGGVSRQFKAMGNASGGGGKGNEPAKPSDEEFNPGEKEGSPAL